MCTDRPEARRQETTSIKVVSVPRSDADKTGLPATTLVFDEDRGGVRAIMNARALTAVRTACVFRRPIFQWTRTRRLTTRFSLVGHDHCTNRRAASALALSLSPNARHAQSLIIFGAGLQALWHAKLVSSLSPDRLTRVTIACRALNPRAASLLAELQRFFDGRGLEVRVITIEEATAQGGEVETADLVCWYVSANTGR